MAEHRPAHVQRISAAPTEMFGPYRIEALLGRGGMGEVHRAFDTTRSRVVALKRLPADLAGNVAFEARFRRESALVATLRDPHVIPIHDYGEIDGRLFLDMRLVEGVDLATALERHGPLPAARAVEIASQVASALDSAHAEGLVHRDVKPSNVLITGNPGREFAYLIDFGIARTALDSTITGTGETVGTLAYMAPERFLHGGGDARGDVYALGCLLFVLLTGRLPFPGHDLPVLLYAHLNTPPPRPSECGRDVPVALDAVIAQAMAKNPEHRHPSAGDLATAAQAALASPGPAVVPAPRRQRPRTTIVATPTTRPGRTTAPTRTGSAAAARLTATASSADDAATITAPIPSLATPRSRGRRTLSRRTRYGLLALLTAIAVGAGVVLWLRPGIAVADHPSALAVTPDGARAYVVHGGTERGSLAVVDLRSGTVDDPVSVGSDLKDVTVTPDGRRAYVTDDGNGGETVSIVDTATGTRSGSFSLPSSDPSQVRSLAVAADNRLVYVSSLLRLYLFDAATGGVVATLPNAGGLGLSRDGARLYVAHDQVLDVVDTARRTVVGTIPVGDVYLDPVVAPDGRHAYLAVGSGVLVVDTGTMAVTGTVLTGSSVSAHLAVAPDGSRLYVTDLDDVVVVDTATRSVIGRVDVGSYLNDVAASADGTRVYVLGDRMVAIETTHDTIVDI